MNNIDLSVIIPCYNASKYCGQIAECITNQIVGGGNIEFILVDDGSKDNTLSHLKEIRASHPKHVRVIAKTNGGVSSARNAGLEIACGTWIGFLDSDDLYAPGGLQYILSHCVSEDIDIIQFESKSLPKAPSQFEKFTSNVIKEIKGCDFYLQTTSITVWRFLYRKDYIKKAGLRFRELSIGEDTLFNFEAFMANGSIRCVDTIVTYHIDREGSLTTSINPTYVRKIVESAIYMQKVYTGYLSTHEVTSEIIDKVTTHRERNVRFVFRKIRVTPDFTIKEIRNTANQFKRYTTLPIHNAKGQDKLINFMYAHPYIFKSYIYAYCLMRKVIQIIRH